MRPDDAGFESSRPGRERPIKELGLAIAGSPLEPVLEAFRAELREVGLTRVRPRFYLSTEWGVPEGTVAVAIPFYLADAELTAEHACRVGHVEGHDRDDLLRYLRHEMGHVVNYAYRLYDTADWVEQFGPITRPYREEYQPRPFSRRFVRHLPGWYAQKHPDEDWAETFAVWMTPGLDWRAEYAHWPIALAKLEYCARAIADVAGRDPVVSDDALDLDVGEIGHNLHQFYEEWAGAGEVELPGVDGALRTIFEDLGRLKDAPPDAPRKLASALIDRLETDLIAAVFRWTGHFPERTRPLLRHLAARADRLHLLYPEGQEARAAVALTSFVTTLAMNHVRDGSYLP